MSGRLGEWLAGSPFQSYVYSYPHKTAYRELASPVRLRDAWAHEDRAALFLYLHVPFCEQRCGFCNLFTRAHPEPALVESWLDAIERQAVVVGEEIAPRGIARLAIGGGTPTWLSASALERLLSIAARMGAAHVPCSVETSPATATPERLAVLREFGVTRMSIGVQSTLPTETAALRRQQDPATVEQAINRLRTTGFPVVNVDLMYGQDGQTPASLRQAIDSVIDWGANELYLYPLYIRPLTVLGRSGSGASPQQMDLYRVGRDHLRARGWRQRSMRLYQAPEAAAQGGPPYRCQDDGMIGLGAGARSYTAALHYSSGYAVGQREIAAHIDAWSRQSAEEMALIRHGYVLDGQDQRRRYAILSLLETGIDASAWQQRFGSELDTDLPMLQDAVAHGLLLREGGIWRLSEAGTEHADVLGRWLFSEKVEQRMATWSGS